MSQETKKAVRKSAKNPRRSRCPRPREFAWYFDALDDATEEKLSAIVCKAAS